VPTQSERLGGVGTETRPAVERQNSQFSFSSQIQAHSRDPDAKSSKKGTLVTVTLTSTIDPYDLRSSAHLDDLTTFTYMGRDKVATASVPRPDRARLAKDTINKTIPTLLKEYPKAQAGVNSVQLLSNLPPSKSFNVTPIIRIINADTLEAARSLYTPHPTDRIGVLSMASPLRPGGGVLTGATSQEESLCMRTTLYPSLRDNFYRLPEDALIYTPDILVFRNQDLSTLPKNERFFVDVLSCAALRFPELENGRYIDKDREVMTKKLRLIMRAAVSRGCKRLVLGAIGCGAYANPVKEVAEIFRKVICGNTTRKNEEAWGGIEEIVLAIRGPRHIRAAFREAFEGVAEKSLGDGEDEAEE
jgi:uncharacterized protein (TIGR02452 family)